MGRKPGDREVDQRWQGEGWKDGTVGFCNWKSQILEGILTSLWKEGNVSLWDGVRWKVIGDNLEEIWSKKEKETTEGLYLLSEVDGNICWEQGRLGWVERWEIRGKDLEEWRIQEGVDWGQTGLLSNIRGLTKNEWHEFQWIWVGMVDCLSQKHHMGAWEQKQREWVLKLAQGWRLAGWKQWEDKGQISCMCGKTLFVLTDLAFQAR